MPWAYSNAGINPFGWDLLVDQHEDQWRELLGELPEDEDYRATAESKEWALRLLCEKPATVPTPDIWVDADGHVTFDWESAPDLTVSAAVDDDGFVHFAYIRGDSVAHGRVAPGENPWWTLDSLVQHLRRAS